MTRRKSLEAFAALTAAASLEAAVPAEPIQLHVELEVAAGKETELVQNFKKIFRPTISKQDGFVEVKLLRLRTTPKGDAPKSNWRLLISFKTEEQRVKWVATADHQRVWPSIEGLLTGQKFGAVLYDVQ